MNLTLIVLLIISFLISLSTTGLIKNKFSQQLLDIPNERSSHKQPTPRGGGLGFVIAFLFVGIVCGILSYYFPDLLINNNLNEKPLLMGLILTPLAITGIIDDKKNLSSLTRYTVQLLTAILIIINFDYLHTYLLENWSFIGTIIEIIITIIGITAMINFYNFMDGLDGIVAGVTAVQLAFISLYFQQYSLLILVAALMGFLYWNWSPAKIFMGDVGSTFLGAIVAIAILSQNNMTDSFSMIIITLPLTADAVYTIFCRLIRRENIFQAHRSHIYQRLHQSGWTHSQVTISYIIITLVMEMLIIFSGNLGKILSLILILLLIILTEFYLGKKLPSPFLPFPPSKT